MKHQQRTQTSIHDELVALKRSVTDLTKTVSGLTDKLTDKLSNQGKFIDGIADAVKQSVDINSKVMDHLMTASQQNAHSLKVHDEDDLGTYIGKKQTSAQHNVSRRSSAVSVEYKRNEYDEHKHEHEHNHNHINGIHISHSHDSHNGKHDAPDTYDGHTRDGHTQGYIHPDDVNEPIFAPKRDLLDVVMPEIRYPTLMNHYRKSKKSPWDATSIDFSKDVTDWVHKMNDPMRNATEYTLGFFTVGEPLVIECLDERLQSITLYEARRFYDWQKDNENIHHETYLTSLRSIIPDPVHRAKILGAVKNLPAVKGLAEWARKWSHKSVPIRKTLFALYCVEGAGFSDKFGWINYLKNKGLMPGLAQSNDYIAPDEGNHVTFGGMMCQILDRPPSEEEATEIMAEFLVLGRQFVREAILSGIPGLTPQMMLDHVQFYANHQMKLLKFKPFDDVGTELADNKLASLISRVNFFEAKNTDYQDGIRITEYRTEVKEFKTKTAKQLMEEDDD